MSDKTTYGPIEFTVEAASPVDDSRELRVRLESDKFGKANNCLALVLDCERFAILGYEGAYLMSCIEQAGYSEEELGLDAPPDGPGYYVLEGEFYSSTDWETGICDDCGVTGPWRKARQEDFTRFDAEMPMFGSQERDTERK